MHIKIVNIYYTKRYVTKIFITKRDVQKNNTSCRIPLYALYSENVELHVHF